MSFHDLAGFFIEGLGGVSDRFGTGDVPTDALILGIVLTLACTIVSLIMLRKAEQKPQPIQPERFPLGGKIEKLERSLNELRTEVRRSIELLKDEVGHIRQEVQTVTGREIQPASSLTPERELFPAQEPVPAATQLPSEESAPLTERLQKSRHGFFQKIRELFSLKPTLDQAILADLRALLIGSDLGVRLADSLLEQVSAQLSHGQEINEEILLGLLKAEVLSILESHAPVSASSAIQPVKRASGPLVVMLVGVNGVGKTTTVAKLAHSWKESGAKVLMVAADTFRAAAVDQLSEWGHRTGVPVATGQAGAKPATVVFDAMVQAQREGVDAILIDTAGRLHTKSNLMQELEGVKNAISRHQVDAPHEVILVLDGSTGQNAVNQAREFNEAVKLSGLIITKLDGTAKGGIVVAIKEELGIPVRYIGVGESVHHLKPFDAKEFVDALFDTRDPGTNGYAAISAHGEVRRRRRANGEVAA